ncbi:hypothetical protein [Fulvivirga sp.]|uniref:hypothetical protein n=1 Tax=Fulvivirga sp. TaxID=1931237 RepID=UPI0032EC013C
MKNAGYLILSILLISFAVLSCAEEEEELEGIEAITSVKFIDNDSLASLNASKSSKSAMVKTIEARITAIDADPNKGALLDEKDSLNKVKSTLNEEIKTLNTLITNVNSGLAEVSSINSVPPNVKAKKLHTLYLNSNDTISKYSIIIYDRLDTLDLVYEQEFQYVENQLKVISSGVRVNHHSYDSVTVSCKNCLSHDAQLTVYF